MPTDEHIQSALDRILTGLRGQLEPDLRAYAEEQIRLATAERDRVAEQALEEARRHSEAQLAQLREAATTQNEDLRKSAESQIAELRRLLDDLRRSAEQQIDGTRRTLETDVAAARERADLEIEDARRVAQVQVEDVQRAMEERFARMRGEVEDTRRSLLATQEQVVAAQRQMETVEQQLKTAQQQRDTAQQQRDTAQLQRDAAQQRADAAQQQADAAQHQADAARQQVDAIRKSAAAEAEGLFVARLITAQEAHDRRLTDAVDDARTRVREAGLRQLRQLVEEVQSLDAARSLGDVLERLTQFAGREAERSAVLLVKGDRLREWRMAGFGPASARPVTEDLTLDAAGLAGAAVREGRVVARIGDDGPPLPPFAASTGSRDAMALPVIVGGAVVALLYADASPSDSRGGRRWPATLDVLVRHASRVLEAMTVCQAAGLWTPPPAAGGDHGSAPGRSLAGGMQ